MKTIKSLMLCALMFMFALSTLAADLKVKNPVKGTSSKISYTYKAKGMSSANRVTVYSITIDIVRNYMGPGLYHNYIGIGISEDYSHAYITLPFNAWISAEVQTHSTHSTTVKPTIYAGNSTSGPVLFVSDHLINFATDIGPVTQSGYSYNGIPVVLDPIF